MVGSIFPRYSVALYQNGIRRLVTTKVINTQPFDNTQASKATDISRSHILGLYRKILQTADQWPVPDEQAYIREEARLRFRENMNLVDVEKIKTAVCEAESRLQIGKHYRIPYPRKYYYTDPFSLTKKTKRKRERRVPRNMDNSSKKIA